jgi:HEAT repeat protein
MMEAPVGDAIDPRALQQLTGTIQIGAAEPEEVRLVNRRTARQGMAVLLVLPMPKARPVWKDAARELINTVGPWDTVAVGVIDRTGFRLIQSFSADPLGVITAIGSLQQVETDEDANALRATIPIHRGLLEALDSFKKGQLPELRSMVFLGDGRDATIRRSSARDRIEQFILQRAHALGVRLSLVTTRLPTEDSDVQRMQDLARASGGVSHLTNGDGEKLGAALRQLGEHFAHWVVAEYETTTFPKEAVEVALAVNFKSGRKLSNGKLRFPEKRRLGVKAYDLGLPAPPAVTLPPGVESEDDLVNRARSAQKDNDWLTAGALWHLAALAMPEDRRPTIQAGLMDTSFAQSPRLPGSVVYRGKPIKTGTPIEKNPSLYPTIWRERLQSERQVTHVLLPANPEVNEVELPPNQIVLWPTTQKTTEAVARELLVSGRATHLFIASDGTVSQLADLATQIKRPETASKRAIHIHIHVPPGIAPVWQDPDDYSTWRQTRPMQGQLEVNDNVGNSWGLTLSQSEILIRLLAGLTDAFDRIKPVFPVLANGKPSLGLVVDPNKYLGLISATCLEAVSPDLARSLDINGMNISIQRYSTYAKLTDMESWISELGLEDRAAGAIARFEHIGPQATPLLVEAAKELGPKKALGALRALAMIGDNDSIPGIVAVTEMPLGEEETAPETLRAHLAARLLVRVGGRQHLSTLASLVDRARTRFGDEAQTTQAFQRLHASLLIALAEPSLLEDINRLYETNSEHLRALAVLGWSRLNTPDVNKHLQRALSDTSPWVRLYAIKAIGSSEQNRLPELIPLVGLRAVVDTLSNWPSENPIVSSLDWYINATPALQDTLGSIFIRWKWKDAIRRLAPDLRTASQSEQERILRILRGITGRDFGSAPDRYLQWAQKE